MMHLNKVTIYEHLAYIYMHIYLYYLYEYSKCIKQTITIFFTIIMHEHLEAKAHMLSLLPQFVKGSYSCHILYFVPATIRIIPYP